MTTTTIATAPPARRSRTMFGHRALDLLVLLLTLILIVIYLWPRVVVFVRSGEAGVVWRTYGGGTDVRSIYGEGIHVVAPWNEFYKYNVRLQQVTRTFETTSSDGLHMAVVASVRFRPRGAPFPWRQSRPNALGALHKFIGPDYVNVAVIPETGAAIRRQFDEYDIDDIYMHREEVEREVLNDLRLQLAQRYIDVDDLLLDTIRFPPSVQGAIEGKLMEEESSKRYEYILAKERQEAERKRIEAAGVRDFQRTVAAGLTDEYLRWKAIEAMTVIAKSENSKVIIIGGQNGMPVILNAGDTTPAARVPVLPAGPAMPLPPIATPAQPTTLPPAGTATTGPPATVTPPVTATTPP